MKYLLVLLLLTSCGTQTFILPKAGPSGAPGPQGPAGPQGFGVGELTMPATANECPQGGSDIIFFRDLNNDGLRQDNEPITSVVQLCNGINGISATITVSQATAAVCPSGGLVFESDNNSVATLNTVCNGTTGPQGQQGPQGVDLDSITMVQFCQGYTTTYPNSFPEFGMCVNNTLYAVYWDQHNSWLAQIAPGYYASTSTSAPCNFTVVSNCGIQH